MTSQELSPETVDVLIAAHGNGELSRETRPTVVDELVRLDLVRPYARRADNTWIYDLTPAGYILAATLVRVRGLEKEVSSLEEGSLEADDDLADAENAHGETAHRLQDMAAECLALRERVRELETEATDGYRLYRELVGQYEALAAGKDALEAIVEKVKSIQFEEHTGHQGLWGSWDNFTAALKSFT